MIVGVDDSGVGGIAFSESLGSSVHLGVEVAVGRERAAVGAAPGVVMMRTVGGGVVAAGVSASEMVQAVAVSEARRVRRKTMLRGATTSSGLEQGAVGEDVEVVRGAHWGEPAVGREWVPAFAGTREGG